MKKYEVIENDFGTIIKLDFGDGRLSFIPADPANSDYAAYLESLEPNLPEVEETPETPEAE